jgi:hypothetical protein
MASLTEFVDFSLNRVVFRRAGKTLRDRLRVLAVKEQRGF